MQSPGIAARARGRRERRRFSIIKAEDAHDVAKLPNLIQTLRQSIPPPHACHARRHVKAASPADVADVNDTAFDALGVVEEVDQLRAQTESALKLIDTGVRAQLDEQRAVLSRMSTQLEENERRAAYRIGQLQDEMRLQVQTVISERFAKVRSCHICAGTRPHPRRDFPHVRR